MSIHRTPETPLFLLEITPAARVVDVERGKCTRCGAPLAERQIQIKEQPGGLASNCRVRKRSEGYLCVYRVLFGMQISSSNVSKKMY